jgi:hypothetical protein
MRQGSNVVKISGDERLAEHLILKNRSGQVHSDQGSAPENTGRQEVIIYGKTIFLKEPKNAALAKDGSFELAIADFLHGPFVEVVDFSQFTGRVGSYLFVTLSPHFPGNSVFVKMETKDGKVIHEGFADQGLFQTEWTFVLNQNPTGIMADKISITASTSH